MGYKIIVINPFDKENGLIDGDIKYIGDVDSDFIHSDLLIDYGLGVYGDDSIFGLLSNGNYLPDIPAYFLAVGYNNVVFLNVSDNRAGRLGLLYLPDNVSNEQKKSLNNLVSVLKNYRIEVNYNLRVDDGFVESDRDYISSNDLSSLFGESSYNEKRL